MSVGSGCVGVAVVAEGSGAVISVFAGALLGVVGAVGAIAEGSGVVASVFAGVLLGVVGAVGAVGSADGSVVTMLSGAWVLFRCEPVAVITSPL